MLASRRAKGRLGDTDVWLARADELAVLKMYSERRGDFDDLIALLSEADVDVAYLGEWAKKLDASSNEVSERLARAVDKTER